ncbi:BAG domain-containing protein [Xylariaceae sp. FL1019]|nr:BAG domain-containing protein [Xylariaceae sp. FL1019]
MRRYCDVCLVLAALASYSARVAIPQRPPTGATQLLVKVASSQAALASSGAFQNITALLPPQLQSYVLTTAAHLSDALAVPTEYLLSKGASTTVVYSTLAGATAVALPILMSRYGWPSPREGLSPFASHPNSQDGNHVTDDDFDYITSEDIVTYDQHRAPERSYDRHNNRRHDASPMRPNDILYIRHKGAAYELDFPSGCINNGKLYVGDVQERLGLVMDLSSRRASRVKILYKGRHLKEAEIPIRDYGVKPNSELMVVVPEGRITDDEDSSGTPEEVVVLERDERTQKKKKNKNGKVKKPKKSTRDSTANLEVPGQENGDSRRASPDPSRHPSRVPSPAVPVGPLEKLAAIRSHFEKELLPLCNDFRRQPPKDAKKKEDEHRRISETVMQHVLLKLDEVDTGGDPDIRAKRKDLVNYVQDVLKDIDDIMPPGSKINR